MGIKSNNLLAAYHDFFSRSGKDAVGDYVAPAPFQASGGNVADGIQPGNGWTYHVFTTPGNFTVSSGSGTVQYVVIGGGGGGGNEDAGGGGGAGALITGSTTVNSPQGITIGLGGAGSNQPYPAPNGRGDNGGDTIFGTIVTANGGGGGGSGNYNQPNKSGSSNGNASGGGGGWRLGAGGAGGAYGNNGGAGNSNGPGSTNAGGGGGAGGVGETMPNTSHSRTAAGGDGAPAGPGYDANLSAFAPMPSTWKSIVGPTGVFAGGGGGGADHGPDTTAAAPGGGGYGDSGGCSGPDRRATQGLDNTGSGGGGGGGCSSGNYPGQPGGDGIVILRHQGNTGSSGSNYTTRGIIFDYDPGLLSFSDGTTLNNSSVLEGGLVSGNNQTNTTVDCSQGSLTYKTANGGYISGETSTGLMLAGGVALQQALDACQSITLTCWFYHPGDARHALMSRFGSGWTGQFNHFIDPNRELHYNFSGAISNAQADINTSVFSANTWTLCHNTYDVSTGVATWYMNGSSVATANLGTDGGNGLTVSSSASGQGFGWMARADYIEANDGRMGKVRIHNVALTASECLYDFNQQKSIYGL